MRDDLKLKMKEVEAKKHGTEVLLEEMGVQRSEAEAQQVRHGIDRQPIRSVPHTPVPPAIAVG